MEIIIIAALDQNNAIGYQNDLLAHISADLKRFKTLTSGHAIVMGRKTFESLPKGALPNRRNLVLTANADFSATGVETVSSVQQAIKTCDSNDVLFVIGGASVYNAFLPHATQLKLTFIQHRFELADTYFPAIDYSQWQETARTDVADDAQTPYAYSFVDFVRR